MSMLGFWGKWEELTVGAGRISEGVAKEFRGLQVHKQLRASDKARRVPYYHRQLGEAKRKSEY